MMLSAEARWFWRGAPPDMFEQWFMGARTFALQAGGGDTRVDQYLRAPHQRELGIKQRGSGDVEIKGLFSRRQAVVALAGLSASPEIWGKWPATVLDLSGMPILRIAKRPWMRRFGCSAGQIQEASAVEDRSKHPDHSCNCEVELTRLTAPDDSRWWTFGFESHGTLADIEQALARTVAFIAAKSPPQVPPVGPASYPAWLSSQRW